MPSDADIRGSTTTVEQESGDDAEPRDTDGSRLSTRIKALKGVEATLATAKSAHGILTFFHARVFRRAEDSAYSVASHRQTV